MSSVAMWSGIYGASWIVLLICAILRRGDKSVTFAVSTASSLPPLVLVGVLRLHYTMDSASLALAIGAVVNLSILVGSGFRPFILLPVPAEKGAGPELSRIESQHRRRVTFGLIVVGAVALFLSRPMRGWG